MEIINTDGQVVPDGFCFHHPGEAWPEDPLVVFVLFEARLRAKAAGWTASVRTHKTARGFNGAPTVHVKRFRAESPSGGLTLALDISLRPDEMDRWSEFNLNSRSIPGLGDLATINWQTPEQAASDRDAARAAWDASRAKDDIANATRFVEQVAITPEVMDAAEVSRLRQVALDFMNRR